MKVQITKDSKRLITLEDMPAVKAMIAELKEDNAKFDLEILSGVFKTNTPNSYEAEIAKNRRLWNYYSDNSKDYDIWVETTLPETYENGKYVIYKVGCYLSDIWSISADNKEEIKSHMYIRKFVEA
jgi:hypothetical protein